MNDLAELTKFTTRYAKGWYSQNPESVAAFFARNGSPLSDVWLRR
jgi:hypothetical protein